MLHKQMLVPDADVLDRLAVLTGRGWTTSILGYLTTVVGHGAAVGLRLVTGPRFPVRW